jgi:hypothetical protein
LKISPPVIKLTEALEKPFFKEVFANFILLPAGGRDRERGKRKRR